MMPGIPLAGWALTRPFRADAPGLAAVAGIAGGLAAPVATNRRIAVMSLDGGAGTSAVAAGVASALSRTRPAGVLAVSAHRAARGVGWHLGLVEQAPGRPSRAPLTVEQARALAAPSPAGPLVLSAGDGSVSDAVDAGAWWDAAGGLTRFFDVTVTDFGRRPLPDDARHAAERSHAVCLVSHADRYSAELAAHAASRLADGDAPVPVVLCLVDRQGLRARVAPLLRSRGAAAITMPRERTLEGGRVSDGGFATATRIAVDLLAADLLTVARGVPAARTAPAAEVRA